jgi:Mor family transcriptional regulator
MAERPRPPMADLPALPRPADHSIEANRIRDAEIRGLWRTGQWTLAAIARKYRLSDSRAWQIINGYRPHRTKTRPTEPQPMGDDDA